MMILQGVAIFFMVLWTMFLLMAVVLDIECKFKLKKKNLIYYKWTTLAEINSDVEILELDTIRIVHKMIELIAKLL